MKSVSTSEARENWSRLLDEASRGEKILIKRRGVSIAMLMPPPAYSIEEMWRWQEETRLSLGGITIRELIEEGRR
jgi:antitoxin (DNA-binding transcriptional repressor) of toxin-antitoxin stability system